MNLYSYVRRFWILLLPVCAFGDIVREDSYFEGEFSNNHKGRMLRVLMVFNDIPLDKCAVKCIQHIRCKTVNYNFDKSKCELTDVDFNDDEADKLSYDWYNIGTHPKANGKWGSWMNVTQCTATCGVGTLIQARDCDSPEPAHGGDYCVGGGERTIDCNTHSCPVNGSWGEWKNLIPCTATCNGGLLYETRECDSPRPQHGGDDCIGQKGRTVSCNTNVCPAVNGAWGAWRNITPCTATCIGGTLKQTRKCDSPRPEHGGNDCSGENARMVRCNEHACPVVVNIALEKLATQSSTFLGFPADSGNDGEDYTWAVTEKEDRPWWQVDLGKDVKIEHIIFRASQQYFLDNEYKNMVVMGKSATTGSIFERCNNLVFLTKDDVKFSCTSSNEYRYIKLVKLNHGSLSVKEFEVYAKQS